VTRRVRTLLVGCTLLVALLVLVFALPVPYVILSPGETFNTLGDVPGQRTPIIAVTGKTPNQTSGTLILTTVDESTGRVSIISALAGWLQHDRIVVPHDAIVPPGTSQSKQNQQDTADFVGSQDDASAAAFCELGYPKGVLIEGYSTGTKAKNLLKVGDGLVSIDGQSADTVDKLTTVLEAATPAEVATVVIERAGIQQTVMVPLIAAPAGSKGARIGVSVAEGCVAPFQVDLGLADQIGGPSGGLMFALGIMDKVGPTDLTKGLHVAGTGTIDPTGAVGAIGGIQLKMIAAQRAGATVFLAPASNCTDVRGNIPNKLNVVKVDTLHSAVSDLLALQQGKDVPHC
jgi:PDZ domain-containing protein